MKTLARAADQDTTLSRLSTLRPDTSRRWGRMSAHQMVCHLSDCFRMALGSRIVRRRPRLHERTVLKWVALYAPLTWPQGLQTTTEVDQEAEGTAPAAFDKDMAELVDLFEIVTSGAVRMGGALHPVFGRMSHRQWLRWAYLHMDHHLRQFGL